jgi:OmpR-family two-component system manganese-sensing sensor histidine kinase
MEVVEEQQMLAAEKNITLSLDLVDPPEFETTPELIESWFTLAGDWDQLARLFTNLIGNAVQYTPDGGRVRVELQRIAIGKELPLSLSSRLALRPSDMLGKRAPALTPLVAGLQVKVSDTGIGIPESALPRLFNRFYRVDPARTHAATNTSVDTRTGSGLGLAIAAAIVENHQGQIQVESTLHQGTIFTVTLPLRGEA